MKIATLTAGLGCAVGLIGILVLGGCEDRSNANRVLIEEGYSQIEFLGPAFFACSEDDTFKTKFRAVNANGVQVDGVVCSGWMKGSTIRRF